jgi:hypothetical protein
VTGGGPGRQQHEEVVAGISASEYGPAYNEHVLEMYKLYVEMADRTSQRRERANAFFLAINTSLVAYLARPSEEATTRVWFSVLVPLVGIMLSYLWAQMIRSYRGLNSAKFQIVHSIENRLPMKPYDAEWEAVGRGKDSKLYLPFTHVEGVVPWVFVVFYVLLLGHALRLDDLIVRALRYMA